MRSFGDLTGRPKSYDLEGMAVGRRMGITLAGIEIGLCRA